MNMSLYAPEHTTTAALLFLLLTLSLLSLCADFKAKDLYRRHVVSVLNLLTFFMQW